MIDWQKVYKYTRILQRGRELVKEFNEAWLDPTDAIQLCVDASNRIKQLSKWTFMIKKKDD
jgi:hypothetical protein